MTKLKYLSLCFKITDGMKKALSEIPRRGGYYNWIFLHQGDIMPLQYDLDLEKYDVVSINMSPVDQLLVPEARRMIPNSSSTLLVLNNDYVAEAWSHWGTHPLYYQQIQEMGDCCFSTEPHQVSLMRDDTYTIPHPHYIRMLKHIDVQWSIESNTVGAIYHWWAGDSYIESLLLYKLKRKYPHLISKLYAYNEAVGDKMRRWQKVLFDVHLPGKEYGNYLHEIGKAKFILENGQWHTYGRNTVDTAALGIPSVGSDRIFSMKHCWPELVADPLNGRKMLELMEKIIKGGSWLDNQLDHAYEASEYFNYKNSRERYMAMIEETRQRLGK